MLYSMSNISCIPSCLPTKPQNHLPMDINWPAIAGLIPCQVYPRPVQEPCPFHGHKPLENVIIMAMADGKAMMCSYWMLCRTCWIMWYVLYYIVKRLCALWHFLIMLLFSPIYYVCQCLPWPISRLPVHWCWLDTYHTLYTVVTLWSTFSSDLIKQCWRHSESLF